MGTKELSAKAIGEEENVASILNDFANRPFITDYCMIGLLQLASKPDSDAAKKVAKKLAGIPNPSNSQLANTINHHLGNKTSIDLQAKQDNETNTIGMIRVGVRAGKFDFENNLVMTNDVRFDSFLNIINELNRTNWIKKRFSGKMLQWELERVYFDSEGKKYDKGTWVWKYTGEGNFDPYDDATIGQPSFQKNRRKSDGSFQSRYTNDEKVDYVRQINTLKSRPTDYQVSLVSSERNNRNSVMNMIKREFKTEEIESLLEMPSFQAVVKNGASSLPTVIAKREEDERKADVTERVVAEAKLNPKTWMDSDVYREALAAKVLKKSLEKAVKDAAKKSSKKKKSKSTAVEKENINPVKASTSARLSTAELKLPATHKGKDKSTVAMRESNSRVPAARKENADKAKAGKAKAKRKSNIEVLGDESETECESKPVSRSKKFCSRGKFDDRCMEVKDSVDELEDYVPSDESDNDDD